MTDTQAKRIGWNSAMLSHSQELLEQEEAKFDSYQQVMAWNGGGLSMEDLEEYELLKERIEILRAIIKSVSTSNLQNNK